MTDTSGAVAGTLTIPETQSTRAREHLRELDAAVATLRDHADEWARLPLDQRLLLLDHLEEDVCRQLDRWVRAALAAKDIPAGTPAEGEEWIAGPACVLRNIDLLRRSLADLRDHGRVRLPGRPRTRDGGQVVVPVFPTDAFDKVLWPGFRGEVWMQPNVSRSNFPDYVASSYRTRPAGRVAVVLGAGNVSSIGPMDALYKLYVEQRVVVLKMNPVNEYLGPILEDCFRAFIDRGFLRIVYGGAAEGKHLCEHPEVDEIHITGSDKTHDAIVFGPGDEGARRKSRREPVNERRITSELGNVSPMIVVPGPWSGRDVEFHATSLVSSLANNAGFNCNATRVIVTHRGWPQRDALLDAIRDRLQRTPARTPYYPGACERYRAFVEAHPEAERFGPEAEGRVPWTLVPGLDATLEDDICFRREAFCGVTSEVPLKAKDTVDYIRRAVHFCNETLWGTLSAGIVVHPETMKDPIVAEAVERAIAKLRYGTVALNHWPALGFVFVSPPWGAYPGQPLHDIQSGRGFVHDTYMLDRPQKSVVRGPFRVRPRPAWFVGHRRAHRLLRKLTRFSASPSWLGLPGIFREALRG